MTTDSLSFAQQLMNRLPGSVLIGGLVRNLVLGIDLAGSDIDLLVPACRLTAEQYLAEYLPDALVLKQVKNTLRLKAHTTAGAIVFDLTVTNDSLSTDLHSRDLTVNSLALNRNMQLLNSYNVLTDLLQSRIETSRDTLSVWAEDPHRIVRALRFKAQLTRQTGKQWQYGTNVRYALYSQTAQVSNLLQYCNQSRLRNEVHRLLKAASPAYLVHSIAELPPVLTQTMFDLAGGSLTLQG